MADLAKLLFPFVSTPKDYPESLQKAAAVLFYELMLVQIILYYNTPLGSAVDSISTRLALDQIVTALDPKYSTQIARLVLAMIVAVQIPLSQT